jgi:hypothetical protein
MAQSANRAVLSAGLQSQYSQSLGNDYSLDFVVWWWDTLENLKSLHSSGTTGGLVGNHATDGLVEDSGRSTEMERTYMSQTFNSHDIVFLEMELMAYLPGLGCIGSSFGGMRGTLL